MKGQVTCYKVTKGKKNPKFLDHQDALIYLVSRREVLKGTDRNEDKVINLSRVYLCTNSKMRSGLSHKVKVTLYIFV